ncbi:VWA domain-containing protein [Streptomyces sp. NPDC059578]|uniref:VWA domain-containing protein n=1 Tax=unclassified Streptomyces TaxID=2593676 RepID=UPI0036493E62
MGDSSRAALTFTLEKDFSPDLAFDATRADVLVTVCARADDESAAGAAGSPTPGAEVFIMDRSLSMAGLGKLDEAKRAICAAIDALRDGTLLGIVAGHHEAAVVYPPSGRLVRVDAARKQEAKAHVAAQLTGGGTAIGTWLDCARQLFETSTAAGAVRHAVLYTDGRDEHESPEELDAVLAACADRFTCDARGLGEDWNYRELHRITEALHGTAAAVIDIADLTQDFVHLVEKAQSIVVPRVYLGVRIHEQLDLGFVQQTRPVQADLTPGPADRGEEIHIPLGAWSPGVRQYQISLRFPFGALPVEEQLHAAHLTLYSEPSDGRGRVPCAAVESLTLRRRSNPAFRIPVSTDFTRVETERELGMAMRACADAHQQQDRARADQELRLALRLAEELGDEQRLRLLRAVADTTSDGRVIVRPDVSRGAMQQLGLDSTRTGPPPVDAVEQVVPAAAGEGPGRCPNCSSPLVSRAAHYCEQCGHRLDGGRAGNVG